MLFIRSLFFYIFFISSIILVSLAINILYLFTSTKTLQNICKYDDAFNSKGFIKCLYPADNEECFNVTDIENSYLQTLCRKIGYKKIQNIFLSKLDPYGSIDIHIDDHISKPELKGCGKFYYQLSSTDGTYFKLGQSGLLPLDKPLLINTNNHTHAVANDSAQSRMVCYMYGQF